METPIPIIIVCYNNFRYVENTIQQLITINPRLRDLIIVMDNHSDDTETIDYLDQLKLRVIRNKKNNGPWVSSHKNREIYETMPERFILTDPDLEFNKNLPCDFCDILSKLSDQFQCEKIGFAISLRDHELMFQSDQHSNGTIYQWESQFWTQPLKHDRYVLYRASIDTTFCLINKKYVRHNYENSIRVAGEFTCRHLPFYVINPILNIYERYHYCTNNVITTTAKVDIPYIRQNYHIINKKGTEIIIKKDPEDRNLSFWKDTYASWEPETFDIFDQYLKKDKIMIDVGGWIGTTCIYGARKSKHVYVIEADPRSVVDLRNNCQLNCHNVTIVDRPIAHHGQVIVNFGRNQSMSNSQLNDSTSQIISSSAEGIQLKTISFDEMIGQYQIDPNQISLIKIDIEGGEEKILEDVYHYHEVYKIPLRISFHLNWWQNQDLDRFTFLSQQQKQMIKSDPFVTLMFLNQ